MKNLEATIGAPEEVGCQVVPPGSLATVSGVASGLFGAVGKAAADSAMARRPTTSPFGGTKHRFGYLALTTEDLILVATKPAMIGHKAICVLGRAPRSAVRSIEVAPSGATRDLTVTFSTGETWLLAVPAMRAKDAQRLTAAV